MNGNAELKNLGYVQTRLDSIFSKYWEEWVNPDNEKIISFNTKDNYVRVLDENEYGLNLEEVEAIKLRMTELSNAEWLTLNSNDVIADCSNMIDTLPILHINPKSIQELLDLYIQLEKDNKKLNENLILAKTDEYSRGLSDARKIIIYELEKYLESNKVNISNSNYVEIKKLLEYIYK